MILRRPTRLHPVRRVWRRVAANSQTDLIEHQQVRIAQHCQCLALGTCGIRRVGIAHQLQRIRRREEQATLTAANEPGEDGGGQMVMSTRFIRLPAVMARTGLSRSAVCARASDGLFLHPVPLGLRTAAWPEHEVEAVLKAHLHEVSDETLRELVADLRKQRKGFGATSGVTSGSQPAINAN